MNQPVINAKPVKRPYTKRDTKSETASTATPSKSGNTPSDSVIVPHSNPKLLAFVTVDRYQRICLSAGLREKLGVKPREHIALYLGYDRVNKRIGLAKPDIMRLTNTHAYNFDSRGYTYAKPFLRDNKIPCDVAYNYAYDGVEGDGWHTFKLVGYDAPDKPLSDV